MTNIVPKTSVTIDEVNSDVRYSVPIGSFDGLWDRARRSLEANGIKFTGHLVQKSEEDLLRLCDFGKTSLIVVLNALGKLDKKLNTTIIGKPENEEEFTELLRRNANDGVARYHKLITGSSGHVSSSSSIPAAGTAIAAVEIAISESSLHAFKMAGRLLGEVAEKLAGSSEQETVPQLPEPFSTIAQAINDAKKQGFNDAAKLLSTIGERFGEADFLEILAEGIKRHDQRRGADLSPTGMK